MELKFEKSKTNDGLFLVYQVSTTNKLTISQTAPQIARVRLTNGYIDSAKVTLTRIYKDFIFKNDFPENEIIDSIKYDFITYWNEEHNPTRKLTNEQRTKIVDNYSYINILLIALEDCINDIDFIREIPRFAGATNSLDNILTKLKEMNYRVYSTIGLDDTVDNGDNADELLDIIKNHLYEKVSRQAKLHNATT